MGKSTHCQKLPVCLKNKSKDERQRKWPSHPRMWIKQLFCNEEILHCDNGSMVSLPEGFEKRGVSFCSHALQRQYSHKLKWSKSLSITPEQLIPTSSFMLCFSPTQVTTNNYHFEDVRWCKTLNHPDTGHITFISYAHKWKQGSRATCEWKLGVFLHLNGHLKCDLGINQWLWKKYDELWRYVLLLYIKVELGDI